MQSTFRSVHVHCHFNFPEPTDFPGPFRKISPRKYQSSDGTGPVYTVGTVRAKIIPRPDLNAGVTA